MAWKKIKEFFAEAISTVKLIRKYDRVLKPLTRYTEEELQADLSSLKKQTGLKKKKIDAICKYYRLNYCQLLEYYIVFEKLPAKENKLIIRHFGIDAVIAAEIDALVATKTQ